MTTPPISVFPRATEKAYGLVSGNVYVFDAPVSANKQQIIDAIQTQFEVTVVSIKTLVQSGKAIRSSAGRRARPKTVNRKDMKKAYVTLAAGDSIKVFDEPAEEKPAKAEKKEAK